jgi:hypothetical protein
VTRAQGGTPLAAAWTSGRRELPLLELWDESIERPLEDFGDVPRGNLMAQQLLRVAQLVLGAPAHGELDRERFVRQGFHLGTIVRPARESGRLNLRRRKLGFLPESITLNLPRRKLAD